MALRSRVSVETSEGGRGLFNTQYSIMDPWTWTLTPETQVYNVIQGIRVNGAIEYVRQGGLYTQYSIMDPWTWTLNPETQAYNVIQGIRVKGARGDVRRGGGVTQYSILNKGPLDPDTRDPNIETHSKFGGHGCQWICQGGGGSLNNQYSIIEPWTLNPETQT